MSEVKSQKPRATALLVDDEPEILKILTHIFKRADVHTVSTSDSPEVYDIVQKHHDDGHAFDMIVLDIRMPGHDGNEVAQQLRDKGFEGIIVALTAHSSDDGMRESSASGFNYYYDKDELNKDLVTAMLEHSI